MIPGDKKLSAEDEARLTILNKRIGSLPSIRHDQRFVPNPPTQSTQYPSFRLNFDNLRQEPVAIVLGESLSDSLSKKLSNNDKTKPVASVIYKAKMPDQLISLPSVIIHSQAVSKLDVKVFEEAVKSALEDATKKIAKEAQKHYENGVQQEKLSLAAEKKGDKTNKELYIRGAVGSYEWAAMFGNVDAKAKLGLMAENFYQQGQDIEVAMEKAKKETAEQTENAASFYRAAAALGHIKAKTNLGYFYLKGRLKALDAYGKETGKEKAFKLLLETAKLGHERAMMHLGDIFAHGDVVEKDLKQAREWYEKAKKSYVRSEERESRERKREIAEAERQIRRIDRPNILNKTIAPFIGSEELFDHHASDSAIKYKSFRLELYSVSQEAAASAGALAKSLSDQISDKFPKDKKPKQPIVTIVSKTLTINEEELERSETLKDLKVFEEVIATAIDAEKKNQKLPSRGGPGGPPRRKNRGI